MAEIRFVAVETDVADAYRLGSTDAYGRIPERRTSDGSGLPCRHCLGDIEAGEDYLILAHRPFSELQPYAETGPIFLHADACERHPETAEPPEAFLKRPQMMVRGYDAGERIVYGTGAVVPTDRLASVASTLMDRPEVAFVHIRSATNNCFQCRVDSASPAADFAEPSSGFEGEIPSTACRGFVSA
jgi:Protein of unknown function (DUF1203)